MLQGSAQQLRRPQRGLRTLLLERNDFGQGTSSRSTKLVHGGVRYLEQFNLTLVLDALRERSAPHVEERTASSSQDELRSQIDVQVNYAIPYYGVGLKAYELLSGKLSFGKSELLAISETIQRLPTIRADGLKGGVLYRDGQFDDSRYAIALMRTLEDIGGAALNYAEVTGFLKRDGKVEGVRVRESDNGDDFDVLARVVINATGAFTQQVLRMDDSAEEASLALSQGTHFVLPKNFLPGTDALMIPKTEDGRVLFAIPWHEQILVGTTDEAVANSSFEPRATPTEEGFSLAAYTQIPWPDNHWEGCTKHMVWAASAGAQRERRDFKALPRSSNRVFSQWADLGNRRKVDYLSQDGRGHNRSCHQHFLSSRRAVAYYRSQAPWVAAEPRAGNR